MTDDEFFELTPRKFHLLVDQHERQIQHQELLFGQIAAATINYGFRAPKKAISIADCMPSTWSKKKAPKNPDSESPIDELGVQTKSIFRSMMQAKLGKVTRGKKLR